MVEEGREGGSLNLVNESRGKVAVLDVLRSIPEEEVWLAGQLSPHTRRAYKQDVQHFIVMMNLSDAADFQKVGRAAIVAWHNRMTEEGAKPRTVRRRLSALSSLFAHLVEHRIVDGNPVRDIRRPRVNRRQGTTRAFSSAEARMILDAPEMNTLRGLRDRAILSVGFQAGPRRSEIASLLVKDFHTDAGYKSLHFIRKGGEDLSLAINPQTIQRIEAYLDAAGHRNDRDGSLFRPVPNKRAVDGLSRHLHPEAVNRILRKYTAAVGLDSGYSAHSMRATFITTALEKGASLEDVQRDVGHADPTTTKLYDRRGRNPEKSASFLQLIDQLAPPMTEHCPHARRDGAVRIDRIGHAA